MAASSPSSPRSAPRPLLRVLRHTSCVRQTCSSAATSTQPAYYFASAQQQRRERHERRQRAHIHAHAHPHPHAQPRPRRTSALGKPRPMSCPGEAHALSPALTAASRTSPPLSDLRSFSSSVDLLAAVASAELSPRQTLPSLLPALTEPAHAASASTTDSPPPLMADSFDSPCEPALPTPTAILPELPALESLPPSMEQRAHWDCARGQTSYAPPVHPGQCAPQAGTYYGAGMYESYPPSHASHMHHPSHPPPHFPHPSSYRSPPPEYYGFAPPHARAAVGVNRQPVYAVPGTGTESDYRPWHPSMGYTSPPSYPPHQRLKPMDYPRPASYWGQTW